MFKKIELKFYILAKESKDHNMLVNEKKTKFFVINGNSEDKLPITWEDVTIKNINSYLYLGSWFTEDGSMKSVLSLHEQKVVENFNKFSIFCAVNTNMPFSFKYRVFNSAIVSSLTYGSESWLCDSFPKIKKYYNQMLRCLLGVRPNTSIELCHIESGINPLEYIINK